MKPQNYLENILKSQTLLEGCDELKALRSEREKVEQLLNNGFNESNPTIQYGGSKAKGTMIRESYDLDIICYFGHDDKKCGETLEEIYNNVKKVLDPKYRINPKTSALRLQNKDPQKFGVDFHIDVVPGRYTDKSKQDAFLYQSQGEKKSLKTNLQKHINIIKDSNLVDTIKLIKLWKIKNGLQIKTFVLELLVVEILKSRCKLTDSKGLDVCLKKFWEQIRDDINNIKIEDPANPTGNDISELLSTSVKAALSSSAKRVLESVGKDRWIDIFGETEPLDHDSKVAAVNIISQKRSDFPKPWSYSV